MLFNSYTFIVFFAIVLLLHNLPLSWRTKKINLLVASYIFYAAWNPPFVILLLISTVLDWFAAKGICYSKTKAGKRAFMIASLVGNLGMLGFFKYGHFLLENFTSLVHAAGFAYEPPKWDIILPAGISFYTFMTLSYAIDVYRGKATPAQSFLDYALFVTFFPHLIAGPILRSDQFLPQCAAPRRATAQQLGFGFTLIVFGLFLKTVLADGIFAPVVNAVYNTKNVPDMLSAWGAIVSFSGQIYSDFAGYSICAIGAAMCLGFVLPANFNSPFGAVGFIDFWSRWHITLSTWMRDYVYFSFRGSRRNTGRAMLNLIFTMVIVGLWHGAAWTFAIWGLLLGVLITTERVLRKRFGAAAFWSLSFVQFLLAQLTFLLICLSAVFFRAGDLSRAKRTFAALFSGSSAADHPAVYPTDLKIAAVAIALILLAHWFTRRHSLETLFGRYPWWLRSIGIAVMFVLMALMAGEDRAFIYFQF